MYSLVLLRDIFNTSTFLPIAGSISCNEGYSQSSVISINRVRRELSLAHVTTLSACIGVTFFIELEEMDEKFGVAARHTTLKDEINEEDIPAVEIIRLESKTNKAI